MAIVDVDALLVDTVWLQRYATYGKYRCATERGHDHVRTRWLMNAAILDGFDRVRHCIAAGAKVTERNDYDTTPLHHAARYLRPEMVYYIACVHEEIVRQLTKCLGRKPTQMEIYGMSTHKKARKFRFHVKQRADVISGLFMDAVYRGELETVRSMVESDEISVNAVNKSTGETALAAALTRQHIQVAMYLLQKGADTYGACDVDGERLSSLGAAVRSRDVDLVREVVTREGLHSPQNHATKCVLFEAAKSGSIEMIETLLELGVHHEFYFTQVPSRYRYMEDVFHLVQGQSRREKNLWLLLCAAYWLQYKDLFEYLRCTHAELQNLEGSPTNMALLLVLAVYDEDDEFVSELLERGADVNLRVGVTAMAAAVAVNSTRMLRLLLDRGGDVTITCNGLIDGIVSPPLLVVAVHAGATDCVRMLLPLETRPLFLQPALQVAVNEGHIESVDLLVDEYLPYAEVSARHLCCHSTKCPIIANLLLARCWCQGSYPVREIENQVRRQCVRGIDPELLNVYVAHGFDVTYSSESVGSVGIHSTTSPLMEAVLDGYAQLQVPAPRLVEYVLKNGMPSLTVKGGKTPEQDMHEKSLQPRQSGCRNSDRRRLRESRDFLAAHSS